MIISGKKNFCVDNLNEISGRIIRKWKNKEEVKELKKKSSESEKYF